MPQTLPLPPNLIMTQHLTISLVCFIMLMLFLCQILTTHSGLSQTFHLSLHVTLWMTTRSQTTPDVNTDSADTPIVPSVTTSVFDVHLVTDNRQIPFQQLTSIPDVAERDAMSDCLLDSSKGSCTKLFFRRSPSKHSVHTWRNSFLAIRWPIVPSLLLTQPSSFFSWPISTKTILWKTGYLLEGPLIHFQKDFWIARLLPLRPFPTRSIQW